MSFPRVCVQAPFESQLASKAVQVALRENPDNALKSLPMALPPADRMAVPTSSLVAEARLGVFVGRMWKNGRTLRVRFLEGGSYLVRSRVRQCANEWSKHANIRFDFIESGDAEIRITFKADRGCWSCIGTDALALPQDDATMNLDEMDNDAKEEEYSGTILHEFGHALGCVHEQSQPNAEIEWNKDAVYKYLGQFGWSRETVDFNIFHLYKATEVAATEVDTNSIMQYSIPKEWTYNDFSAEWSRKLSNKDISFIKSMYPGKDNENQAAEAGNFEVGVYNTMAGNQSEPRRHRKIINFSNSYAAEPAFTTGLNFFEIRKSDTIKSDEMRIKSEVDLVMRSQAILNLEVSKDPASYDSGISWFLFANDDYDFDRGSCAANQAPTSKVITFKRAYEAMPRVLLFFDALEMSKSLTCHIRAYPSELTTQSFRLHIEAGEGEVPEGTSVGWIAFPVNKKGVEGGTFSTNDVQPDQEPKANTEGIVKFKSFTSAPKIFLALNMLSLEAHKTTSVRLSISSVSPQQMTWNIGSGGDTKLKAAGGAYIAIHG